MIKLKLITDFNFSKTINNNECFSLFDNKRENDIRIHKKSVKTITVFMDQSENTINI